MFRAPAWVRLSLVSLLAFTGCSAPTSTVTPDSTEVSRPRRGVSSTGGTTPQPTQPGQPTEPGQPGTTPGATDTTPVGNPPASTPVAVNPVASTPIATGTTPTGDNPASGTTNTTPTGPVREFKVVNPAGTPAVGVTVRFFPGDLGAPSAYRKRRLMATAVNEATTNFDGRIDMAGLADARYNIEAEQSPLAKAFRFNFAVKQESLTMVLQPTGSVSGILKLPGQTDHGGVFVSLLGTPYKATTNAAGAFSMLHVPAGTYHLYAERDGKFTHNVSQVVVKSSENTEVPEATLSSLTPILGGLTPTNGGHGTTVTITADKFLADKTYTVKFGSANSVAATRVNETTLTAKLPVISNTSVSVVNVIVTVDGKDSNALTFTPIKTLEITPPQNTLAVAATRTYRVNALDLGDNAVATPTITWTATGNAITVDQTGTVTGSQPGSGTLRVRSGDLLSDPLTISVQHPVTASTIAGTGSVGSANGPAAEATFNEPAGVAVDGAGVIYVADYRNHLIRRIASGQVSTLAGSTPTAFQNGTGANAFFNFPIHLSLDGTSVLVADTLNQRIRSVTNSMGVVTTLVGTGTIGVLQGGFEDGEALNTALLQAPGAARRGPDGNIYIADSLNHRIRRLAAGTLTTIAGSGPVETPTANNVGGFADGNALTAARFDAPNDLVVAADGTIYVADTNNNRIRRISTDGVVTTLIGNGVPGLQDGDPLVAEFNTPFGLALNTTTNKLYVTELVNHAIREIDLTVNPVRVRTLCGGQVGFQDGPTPRFNTPHGIAVEPSGNLLVADFNNHRIRRITLGP